MSSSNNELKKLSEKIKNLNNEECYLEIYKIINDNSINFSKNNNGVFFDISQCNKDIINKIHDVLRDHTAQTETESHQIEFSCYSQDELVNMDKFGPRLSNKEKNLIKNLKN
jgi:hypothetical protein